MESSLTAGFGTGASMPRKATFHSQEQSNPREPRCQGKGDHTHLWCCGTDTGPGTAWHNLEPLSWASSPSPLHISPFCTSFLCPHQWQSSGLAAGTAHAVLALTQSLLEHKDFEHRRNEGRLFNSWTRFQLKIARGFFAFLKIICTVRGTCIKCVFIRTGK